MKLLCPGYMDAGTAPNNQTPFRKGSSGSEEK